MKQIILVKLCMISTIFNLFVLPMSVPAKKNPEKIHTEILPDAAIETTTVKPFAENNISNRRIKKNIYFDDVIYQLTGINVLTSNATENLPDNSNAPQLAEGCFCRRSFDGRSGNCALAHMCLHVVREYRLKGTKIEICSFRKNIPVICCPLPEKHTIEPGISAQKCQEYHDPSKHIQFDSVPKFSGKTCTPNIPLIVGGEITGTLQHPHMAALGWREKNNEYKWKCGGTLVSYRFVLTAGHCITSEDKPPVVVRLGANKLNDATHDHQDLKILQVIMHPKYRSSSYYHDIALLKLREPVRFSDTVQPACLWQLPELNVTTAIATGWGQTGFSDVKSDNLQKVTVNIVDSETCKDTYGRERRLEFGITDGQFCAGRLDGGKDTCQGDSGGPLHVELPEYNCVKFVIGITSFGTFCGEANAPGVYTKIYPYLDWIEKIVFKSDKLAG